MRSLYSSTIKESNYQIEKNQRKLSNNSARRPLMNNKKSLLMRT